MLLISERLLFCFEESRQSEKGSKSVNIFFSCSRLQKWKYFVNRFFPPLETQVHSSVASFNVFQSHKCKLVLKVITGDVHVLLAVQCSVEGD